jgi:hypothetical protein
MSKENLATATQRLRSSNDRLAEELNKDRASRPPSAPQVAALITLDSGRAQQIAKALRQNHTILTLVSLLGCEPPITPAEFVAFCNRQQT